MHNNSIFHQLFNFIIANFQTAVQFRDQFTGGWTIQTTQANHGRKIVKKRPWTRKKRTRSRKKNPGIELLSHTLLCSTIVVRPLIDRVRDGNVSFKPAIDTGKKYIRKKEEERGEEECCKYNVCCLICWIIVEMWRACLFSWEPSWRTVLKKKGGQASRRISTGKLKTLLFLHIRPIEVVVYDPPSGILLFRDI